MASRDDKKTSKRSSSASKKGEEKKGPGRKLDLGQRDGVHELQIVPEEGSGPPRPRTLDLSALGDQHAIVLTPRESSEEADHRRWRERVLLRAALAATAAGFVLVAIWLVYAAHHGAALTPSGSGSAWSMASSIAGAWIGWSVGKKS